MGHCHVLLPSSKPRTMESVPQAKFTNPFPCASPSPRCPYPPESMAIRSTCRGFRAVCGVSRRRAVSEMALHGAAISCVNLLATTVPVQAAMLEPDVIRLFNVYVSFECQIRIVYEPPCLLLHWVAVPSVAHGKETARHREALSLDQFLECFCTLCFSSYWCLKWFL